MTHSLQKMPKILLHLEGAALFLAALTLYAQFNFGWWQFALLLLVPDLAMVGYLHNEQTGSLCYNVAHTYVLPIVLGTVALLLNFALGMQLAIIWLAHIGLDRLLGYGLKYPSSFKSTHFSKV